ncbi:Rho GTPase-activating protein 17 [Babesia bigemina]|uniref:Rho GTPase-activating protein 17 n=1 Tax=Babesia bigemina TaxID=5866 RepID=A0A061D4I5_BABBI|nr:Rho GTPase-activating protein 17 [Babesia bigemina]CDR95488.1 Rho GTPase-activating protein 17 [Babesia bigemina]|eukprot:XP_012767674.1 Rho GTPase-activating protein 17 [Babesia bigemina]
MNIGRICISAAAAAAMVTVGLLYRSYDGWSNPGGSAERPYLSNAVQAAADFICSGPSQILDVEINEDKRLSSFSSSYDAIDSVEDLDDYSDLYFKEDYWFSKEDATPSSVEPSEAGSDDDDGTSSQSIVGIPCDALVVEPVVTVPLSSTRQNDIDMHSSSDTHEPPLITRKRHLKPLRLHIPKPSVVFEGDAVDEATPSGALPKHSESHARGIDVGSTAECSDDKVSGVVHRCTSWQPKYASVIESSANAADSSLEETFDIVDELEATGWDTLEDAPLIVQPNTAEDAYVSPPDGHPSGYGSSIQGSSADPSPVTAEIGSTTSAHKPLFGVYPPGSCVFVKIPTAGEATRDEYATAVEPVSLTVLLSEMNELELLVSNVRCTMEGILQRHANELYGKYKTLQFTLKGAANILSQLEKQIALTLDTVFEMESDMASKKSTQV